MITDEQISQARTEAQAAEQVRDEAESAVAAAPYSDFAASTLTRAIRAASRARSNANELQAQQALDKAKQLAVATREELEKAAGKFVGQAERELKASRARVAAAAAASQKALIELLDAAGEHDALVRQHAAELRARGLAFEDDGIDYNTGGVRSGALRLRGQWHIPVDPGSLLGRLVYRVAEARLPRLHPVSAELKVHQLRAASRPDGLLEGVEAPARLVYPDPLRLQSAPITSVVGAPRATA